MKLLRVLALSALVGLTAHAADWTQFRGPGGSGDHRGEVGEVGVPVVPGDVVLDRGDPQRPRHATCPFSRTVD